MADFQLWSKDSLVKIAGELTADNQRLRDENLTLRVELNRLKVKEELAKPVAPDTVVKLSDYGA